MRIDKWTTTWFMETIFDALVELTNDHDIKRKSQIGLYWSTIWDKTRVHIFLETGFLQLAGWMVGNSLIVIHLAEKII